MTDVEMPTLRQMLEQDTLDAARITAHQATFDRMPAIDNYSLNPHGHEDAIAAAQAEVDYWTSVLRALQEEDVD